MTNAASMSTVDLCDECNEPMPAFDCYRIEWREWCSQEGRHVTHVYPGGYHTACVPKARQRLDAERASGKR